MPTMTPEGLISTTSLFIFLFFFTSWKATGAAVAQHIAVSGFLLWFLMSHADRYIKICCDRQCMTLYKIYSTVKAGTANCLDLKCLILIETNTWVL